MLGADHRICGADEVGGAFVGAGGVFCCGGPWQCDGGLGCAICQVCGTEHAVMQLIRYGHTVPNSVVGEDCA